MGFLEKSKVTLALCMEECTCAPGSTLTGTLNVEVHKTVSFAAIRLRFRGVEDFYVVRDDISGDDYVDRHSFVHLEDHQTFIGAPTGSSSSNATQLEPGTYTYPFTVRVPEEAPPSFTRKRDDYGCTVAYTMKGYMDITHGFNAETQMEVTVLQRVSLAQLQQARQRLLSLPLSEAHIAACDFCGCCFCCVDHDSFLRTEAVVAPPMVVLHTSMQLPAVTALLGEATKAAAGEVAGDALARPMPVSADPAVAVLRVRVTNFTKDAAPNRCRVALKQRHDFDRDPARLYTDTTFTIRAQDVAFPSGPLRSGETIIFELPLRFDSVVDKLPSGERLLPCLTLKHFAVTTELTVTFPGVDAENTMCVINPVLLADDVDVTSQSVPMPYRYEQAMVVSKDAALLPG